MGVAEYFFHQGTNSKAYEFMGSHRLSDSSVVFRVWAPHAVNVQVVGDFNGWDENAPFMTRITDDGVFEDTLSSVSDFDAYKYRITSDDGKVYMKADPYAFHSETRPGTASKVVSLDGYLWGDDEWLFNLKYLQDKIRL